MAEIFFNVYDQSNGLCVGPILTGQLGKGATNNCQSVWTWLAVNPFFHRRDQSYQDFKQEVADAASWGVLIKIYSG